MNAVEVFEKNQIRNEFAPFKIGDTVKVSVKIKEGEKERIQMFEGVVIAINKGQGPQGSFTVRKVSYGVGVEKVFPYHAPTVQDVVVTRRGRVRRAKLYYLRNLRGKAARIKEAKFDAETIRKKQAKDKARKARKAAGK